LPQATRHLGLDLGATNLKWAVVEHDGDAWSTIDRDQGPTAANEGPDAVVARLVSVAREAVARCEAVTSIGVGVPGLYDPVSGAIRSLTNMPGQWAGKPVAAPMSEALGLPVSLINDARAFGLAELRLGAGRGARSMIGFTLGTGIGGVIAIDAHVVLGHDGTGGELGHQTIDPDGRWCGCGNRGCLEAFARADQIAIACGTDTAEEAIARARAGDRRALAGLADIARYLGIGIANIITVITPDRVVIGGGIGAALDVLLPAITAELQRRVRMTSLDAVTIVAAELGTWAGAIGAALHGAEAVDVANQRTGMAANVRSMSSSSRTVASATTPR
jgi:glucokinase